ncbi:YbbR-like domain-containing protein [Aureivirga marina]|uniref:hypothetical protein n=1 Tax=Aureivirga marina TaxID=1182451 RepID=UPI0018CA807A|nr:hypothetical protein [Aureivirga marina]
MIKLSKEYTTSAYFDIRYINLPKNKELSSFSNKQVHVLIKGTGFNLLKYKLKTQTLNIDLRDVEMQYKDSYYYLPKSHFVKIQGQLDKNIDLRNIYNDTIFLQLNQNISKKIPVLADVTFQFENGNNINGNYSLIPDSVEVYGPVKILKKLNEIYTEKYDFTEVSSNIKQILSLQIPENLKDLSFSDKEVVLEAEVLKFTEANLEIPFTVKNVPEGFNLITFPKMVKVICQVPLNKFSELNEDSFFIECDYKYSEEQNINYLIPIVISKPKFVNSVKIVPKKIEYLISK